MTTLGRYTVCRLRATVTPQIFKTVSSWWNRYFSRIVLDLKAEILNLTSVTNFKLLYLTFAVSKKSKRCKDVSKYLHNWRGFGFSVKLTPSWHWRFGICDIYTTLYRNIFTLISSVVMVGAGGPFFNKRHNFLNLLDTFNS